MSEPDDLWDLLAEPVVDDDRPRRRVGPVAFTAGAIVVAVLVTVAVILRPGPSREPPASSVAGSTIAATDGAIVGSAETTTTLPPFQYPEVHLHGTLVYDPTVDEVVLVGGRESFRGSPILSPWSFDAATGVWAPIESTLQPSPRELATLVFADSLGEVVLLGGSPDATQACSLHGFVSDPVVDVWYLDTEANDWDRPAVGSGPSERWGQAGAWVPSLDGVLMFGGAGVERGPDFALTLGDTWLFEPSSGEWTELEVAGPSARSCSGLAFDPGTGLAYMWGGQVSQSTGDDALWAFDPATLTWDEVPAEGGPDPGWLHQMVYEPTSGLIYVIGGWGRVSETIGGGSTTSVASIDEVWAFDPAERTWEERAPLPRPLSWHAAAPDGHGRIVVYAGGLTLLYDTRTDTWTDVTPYDLLDSE